MYHGGMSGGHGVIFDAQDMYSVLELYFLVLLFLVLNHTFFHIFHILKLRILHLTMYLDEIHILPVHLYSAGMLAF